MKLKGMFQKRLVVQTAFLLFLFVLYFLFAVLLPFNTAPDERMRFQIPQFIFENGFLPHGGDPSLRDPIWGISYAFTPILPYIFGAAFMKIVSWFTTDSFSLLVAARMVSVICGVVTGFFCIKLSKCLFHRPRYRWMFVILCTLLPGFVFACSFVNCDSMAIMSSAIILYAWARGLSSKWNIKSCVTLAVGISFCALSYYNAYGFILCSVILFLVSFLLLYKNQNRVNWAKLFNRTGLIIGIVLVLIAWWFIRNAVLYHGDLLGMRTSNEYAQMYAQNDYKPSMHTTPASEGVTLRFMLMNMHWLSSSLLTFIATLGYSKLLPNFSAGYFLYLFFFAVCLIGFFFSLRHTKHMLKQPGQRGKLLFSSMAVVCVIIPILLSLIYSYFTDFQAQGRYLLPCLVPVMYLAVAGFGDLLERLVKNNTAKRWVVSILCTVYAISPIYILAFIIFPTYHLN